MLKILKYLLFTAYVAGFISGAYVAADVASADTGTTIPVDCIQNPDGTFTCEGPDVGVVDVTTTTAPAAPGPSPDYPAPDPEPDYPAPATPVVAVPAFTG